MTANIYKKFLEALIAEGLSKKQASIILEEYQEAKDLSALPGILERWNLRQGPVKTIKDQGAMVFLEGNREMGQLAATQATKMVAAKAKRYGIGVVGLRNILPFSHPGTYARKLAEQNLFGLVMIDGGRAMVSHPDSPEPVIGTNPLAFGLPSAGAPWVVDMATSKRAWMVVRRALAQGEKLPPATYKTKAGNLTRDPKQAFSVLPFGDYKGFALGLLVETLCGALLDMVMGKRKKAANFLLTYRGAIFIAIDLKRFAPLPVFKKSVSRFLGEVETLKRNKGVKKLRVPGR